MIIDFHTHTFPDKMAERTIAHMEKEGDITAFTDAKRSTLLRSMSDNGVDRSVVLPVATRPEQESTINGISAELNGQDNILFAGAIHPDCADVEGTLDYIKSIGLFGIKLHPDYQGVYFDDPRVVNIIRQAARRGLYIVTHAGMDVAFRDDIHCTPDMVLSVLKELGGVADNKLILAHMGSLCAPDEVLQKLCGLPVYMDTAAALSMYPDKCAAIIKKHGADKILFGTDSPWFSQREYIDLIHAMPISDEEKEMIFYKNAAEILNGKQ